MLLQGCCAFTIDSGAVTGLELRSLPSVHTMSSTAENAALTASAIIGHAVVDEDHRHAVQPQERAVVRCQVELVGARSSGIEVAAVTPRIWLRASATCTQQALASGVSAMPRAPCLVTVWQPDPSNGS